MLICTQSSVHVCIKMILLSLTLQESVTKPPAMLKFLWFGCNKKPFRANFCNMCISIDHFKRCFCSVSKHITSKCCFWLWNNETITFFFEFTNAKVTSHKNASHTKNQDDFILHAIPRNCYSLICINPSYSFEKVFGALDPKFVYSYHTSQKKSLKLYFEMS